ncbi:MAG: hypothetical protein MUC62_09960 [Candidatus Thermoplasmatota archaeon]|nr:hypothetical protein [Candidatus Thermoplasmatota archaeon]
MTSYNDTAIINGQTYYYYIVANNSIDESYPSDILKVWDNKPPVILEDLTSPIATTGDVFNITVNVVDNVLVETVVMVIDDMKDNVTTYHKAFNNNGLCTFKYTAPTRIMDDVMYSISAIDLSGNTAGIGGSFKVIDNDPPELYADNTNYPITTGDLINYSFDIRDNMEVAWANLTFRALNDTLWTLELIDGPGTNWYKNAVFGKSEEYDELISILFQYPPLNLTLTSSDIFGNNMSIDLGERMLVDNDPPVLMEDLTDETAQTGENFTFRFKAIDNIDLSHAEVEYWYMNGTKFRASLPRPLVGGKWEATIEVPVSPSFIENVFWNRTEIECNLTYSFHIWDPSGNEFVSDETQIEIRDTIPPELISHEYVPATGPTTGDPLEITVRLKDNIKVRYAYLLFKFFIDLEHSESEYRIGMNMSTTEEGLFSISFGEIPASVFRFFDHRIEVWDAKNEGYPTVFNFPRFNIIDNDPPAIKSYIAQRNTTTGGKLDVWISGSDNWMVSDVRMDVWSTGEIKQFILEENTTPSFSDEWEQGHPYLYERVLDIPLDSVEPIHLILKVTDQSNNTVSTPELVIDVQDNIAPSLQPITNINIKSGDILTITAVATDNIGIVEYRWEGTYPGSEEAPLTIDGPNVYGKVGGKGTYYETLVVFDAAGNRNETSFTLIVEPLAKDRSSSSTIILIVVLIVIAMIAITIYRVWRSDREPFEKPDIGSESPEPPELGEAPEEPALPPAPEKEVVVVTVAPPTPPPLYFTREEGTPTIDRKTR